MGTYDFNFDADIPDGESLMHALHPLRLCKRHSCMAASDSLTCSAESRSFFVFSFHLFIIYNFNHIAASPYNGRERVVLALTSVFEFLHRISCIAAIWARIELYL